MDKINALATKKMEFMEIITVTMTSTLDFAYNAKISLQQRIDTSQQRQLFKTMEKQIEAKWPNIEANATTQAAVSQDLEIIKDRPCKADLCARNCNADRESLDTIKKSIEKLTEKCLLSETTVATHKNKIKEIYEELVPKNVPPEYRLGNIADTICNHSLVEKGVGLDAFYGEATQFHIKSTEAPSDDTEAAMHRVNGKEKRPKRPHIQCAACNQYSHEAKTLLDCKVHIKQPI